MEVNNESDTPGNPILDEKAFMSYKIMCEPVPLLD